MVGKMAVWTADMKVALRVVEMVALKVDLMVVMRVGKRVA